MMKERFTETRNSGRTLLLEHCNGIKIGDSLITPTTIEEDANRWKGFALLPVIGEENFSAPDEVIFRALIYECMPLIIIGDPQEQPLILKAQFGRFPYSINGERKFQSFAVRLIPKSGKVKTVVLNSASNLAIDSQEISQRFFSADLGNGELHLELFFEKQEIESLPPLKPPADFQEEVKIHPHELYD